jgi:Tfp pilus assembly protein PilN
LLLSGELATEATTSGLLQAEIEYPVEPLVPPLEFPPDLPVAPYAANMGLALKKIPPKVTAKGEDAHFHDINVNLLSGKYRQARARPLSPGHIFIIIFVIMAVGLIFPLYQIRSQLSTDNARLQNELHRVGRELNLATLVAEETAKTEETIKEITARVETLDRELQSLLSARGDFTSNLALVTDTLPPQAYFTSIEIGRDLITVQGETDSPFTVVDYATTLETIETFSEVRIIEIDEITATQAEDTDSEAAPDERVMTTFKIIIKNLPRLPEDKN